MKPSPRCGSIAPPTLSGRRIAEGSRSTRDAASWIVADDVDRFLCGLPSFGRSSSFPAHRLDGLPERSRSQSELEPAARQHVQAGGSLGQHGGWPHGQAGHVGEEPNPAGLPGQPRDQGPRVEVPPLVGMVLDADQVVPLRVGQSGKPERVAGIGPCGDEAEPELRELAHIRAQDAATWASVRRIWPRWYRPWPAIRRKDRSKLSGPRSE